MPPVLVVIKLKENVVNLVVRVQQSASGANDRAKLDQASSLLQNVEQAQRTSRTRA